MLQKLDDRYFMEQAMKEAQKAYDSGEVPVGAVVVCQNNIIARAHNQTQLLNDVTAHAEIIAITSAASYLGNKYLNNCSLYVTLEPCVMCAGALFWAKLDKLFYAADDEKAGYARLERQVLHPKTKIHAGLMEKEARILMQSFFKLRRG